MPFVIHKGSKKCKGHKIYQVLCCGDLGECTICLDCCLDFCICHTIHCCCESQYSTSSKK